MLNLEFIAVHGSLFSLDEDEEDGEDEKEMSNDDLIRTVAEKSNVVTFFCKYLFKIRIT